MLTKVVFLSEFEQKPATDQLPKVGRHMRRGTLREIDN